MIPSRLRQLSAPRTQGGWLAAVAGLLTALSLVTRLPGLVFSHMFNVDESYLAAMGLTIGRGGQLYHDVVDRKPPVLPWLYSLSHTFTGSGDLRPLRLLASLAVAATGVVVTMVVLRLTRNRGAALAAGVLVVLGTIAFLPADGQAANFELFALLPASAAVLMAIDARARTGQRQILLFVGAGAMIGLAGMIKQPFFAMAAPVAWELWRTRPRVAPILAAAAGSVMTVVAIGLPFGLAAVWRWAWADTGDYLGGRVDPIRVLLMMGLGVGLFAALHLPVISSVWSHRSGLRRIDPVVWPWFAGAVIAIVPGFRFITHYFELLVPPMAVLAGLALDLAMAREEPAVAAAPEAGAGGAGPAGHGPDPDVAVTPGPGRGPKAGRPIRRVLVGSAVIATVCTLSATMSFANVNQVSPALVKEIQAHTGPKDRILVWGALPEAYWRSRRLPGQRFLSVGYVTGKWGDRPNPPHNAERIEPFVSRWQIFNSDLRAHPPAVVVDTSSAKLDGWNKYAPANYSFGRILTQCYTKDATVNAMTIWTLADRACVERLAVGA